MKILGLVVALVVSGCAGMGPAPVVGNDRYVTVYDPIGLPGQSEKIAENYCQSKGRTSQYQAPGGNYYMCTGRHTTLCTTYLCVN